MSRASRPRSVEPCVLIVEDEVGTQDALATLLELDGWKVLRAYDGGEALSVLQVQTPDVILTDYMMPNMDGLAMMERLRQDSRLVGIPVALVSATNVPIERRRHAAAFLRKPVDLQALRKVLDRLAARHRDDGSERGR